MAIGFLPLLARILLSIIFISAGWSKLMDPAGTIDKIGSMGLPLPTIAYGISVVIEFLGGILLLIGLFSRASALALAVFCVATALAAHMDFNDQMQTINFMKNLAIAGGMLMVVAFGPGAIAVDNRRGGRR